MKKSEPDNSDLEKIVHSLVAKDIHLEAKCNALIACLTALYVEKGVSLQDAQNLLQKHIAQEHQAILERVEDIDARTAANLDDRPPLNNDVV